MANGKKNYFRHSFFTRNDIKMRQLRDRIGVGFYFYFFTLLEQCGEESCDELKGDYTFHDSTIRSLWGVNLKKSERVANELMSVGLLFFEKRDNTFYFDIPNFAKYLGKYTNKKEPNIVKKRKEKERKEKKSNVEEIIVDVVKKYKVSDSEFEATWVEFGRVGNKKTAFEKFTIKVKSQEMYDKIMQQIKNYKKYISRTDQFSKHFVTWINQECWEDDYTEYIKPKPDVFAEMRNEEAYRHEI